MPPRQDPLTTDENVENGTAAAKKDASFAGAEATNVKKEPPTCEELYGPYPDSLPIPFLAVRNEGREGDAPAPDDIASARSQYDMPVDVRDTGSPDGWLPRDGRLVRLTGRHPFNAEPPLAVLERYRFITPACLHYVRNHGACPRLTWEDHTVAVGGPLVPFPAVFTMDQLAAMPSRELPVTLVCAGNRRKEQNMIRQTIGFNWGCAGVGTNVWKGVLLRDLLLAVGVPGDDYVDMVGRHVEFVGAEDLPNKVGEGPFVEEPWGKRVKYGTSIPLSRAMNPAYDVLVAYQANGERLQPDHGFPVRLVIPGYIGGRMIKWLAAINVLEHETRNHYHYHDNRILPPHVATAEESMKGAWWYRPEYIFNELNINSAIARPDHNERLPIVATNLDGGHYEMAGYAYTGGGRAITRVEISTDGGAHWHLAQIDRRERPTPHGMYWCWVWWAYRLPVRDLLLCCPGEMWCRAWDESNNLQPGHPTWNLMGMGNNQVFRVKVYMDMNAAGQAVFRFEHPTQPGQQTGGWMRRLSDKPDSAGFGRLLEVQDQEQLQQDVTATADTASAKKEATVTTYTMEEVAKHNKKGDCWIIFKGRVYDCTEYLELHPGGVESITMNAGADATEDFVAIHSTKATKMLERYYIGNVDPTSSTAAKKEEEDGTLCDDKGNMLALNPRRKTPFKLQNKVVLSHDSFLLDFALPTPQHVLGLPTGKHVFFSANIAGETVLRRYTPISSNNDVGCVKFVIKAYRPNERFPNGGKMSQFLDSMKVGDYLDLRGPVGEFEYFGKGCFAVDGADRSAARFNMIAGGTGITPVMQIAAEVLRDPDDNTAMSLVFACRHEGDLLLRGTLDEWAARFPRKFRVHYILSDSWPADWPYSTGFVDKALFKECLYEAASDCFNLMCGPPIMLDKGCTPNLTALGHEGHNIFAF